MSQVAAVSGERSKLQSHLKNCSFARAHTADLSDCGLPNYGDTIKQSSSAGGSLSVQTVLTLVRSQHGLTKQEQREFDVDMAHAAFASGIPGEAFNSPALRELFSKWFKVQIAKASVVRGRLLNEAVAKARSSLHDAAQGKEATLCADTWNSPKGDHLMGSILCLDGKVFPLGVVDTTEERHTGAAFLKHLKLGLENGEGPRLEAKITAVCTDAGPDCASARRMLLIESPNIVSIHCFAHQVNLLVSDALKASSALKSTYNTMVPVVDWFRKHLVAKGILRKYRSSIGLDPLVLIRPGTTRWTSAFSTAARLARLRDSLEGAAIAKRQELELAAGKRPDAMAKARQVLGHVRSPSFWDGLDDLIAALEPLAIAAQIAQTDLCRLDQALLTMGKLYTHYAAIGDDMERSTALQDACLSLCRALSKRWMACDQPVWLCALVLNPFFGRNLKAISLEAMGLNHAAFQNQILLPTFVRLFTDAGSTPTDDEITKLRADFMSYSTASGHFTDSFFSIKEKLEAKEHSPVALWEEWGAAGWNSRPIARLALRILRMIPSSAGCERLFSSFLDISDRRRNRINPDKVAAIATIKMVDRQKRLAEGELRGRPARKVAKRKVHGDAALYSRYNLDQENRQEQERRQEQDDPLSLEDEIFEAASNPEAWEQTTRDWLENMGRPDFSDDQQGNEGQAETSAPKKYQLCEVFKMEGSLQLDALQEPAAPWTTGREYMLDDVDAEGEDDEEVVDLTSEDEQEQDELER
ncbi:hypothetical protein CF319_g9105 [Tilletia indica]|nr:hypothetical protein CF319_g9105 [Tilletia indica]